MLMTCGFVFPGSGSPARPLSFPEINGESIACGGGTPGVIRY
jgi:hypothetical protein